jgi:hypothetical protein
VKTAQTNAHGSASPSVIRDAHDIVRGNFSLGIDGPYLRTLHFHYNRGQSCTTDYEQTATVLHPRPVLTV